MLRAPASIVRVAAVAAVAAALAVGAASPALAFGPAEITIVPETTGEDQLTSHNVVCPLTSTYVLVSSAGTNSGAPVSYGPTSYPLDGAGEYSDDFYEESFFDRDTDVTFSIECFDAGNVSTGTDSTVYHLPTTGAVSTAAATRGINQDVVVTGNCGTAADITGLTYVVYQEPSDVLVSGPTTIAYTNVADYSINVGTGTSYGIPVGDQVLVAVQCRSSTPALHFTSNRITLTTMLAAVAAPPVTGGAALANSGIDTAAPLISGGGLLVLGGALLLLQRRRAAAAR